MALQRISWGAILYSSPLLSKIIPLLQIRQQVRLSGVPAQPLLCEGAGCRHIQSDEAGHPAEIVGGLLGGFGHDWQVQVPADDGGLAFDEIMVISRVDNAIRSGRATTQAVKVD